MIAIYSILSSSLNIIAGYTGILSICQAAFYGIGAYTIAIMALKFQTPVLLNFTIAIVLSALFSLVISMPSIRIRDDYFVITTFAFQIIIFSIMKNWVSLTGGPMGLPGIPDLELLGVHFSDKASFLGLISFIAVIIHIIILKIVRSPIGRILRSIREDEIFTASVGKNVVFYKIQIFIISSSMAALGGGLYAYYFNFVDPSSFTLMESIFILSIVIIGGSGSLLGPVAGAVFLVLLPELLRFTGLPSSIAANIRQILYGALLVVFMMWRPQGFLGEYSFDK